MSDVIHVEGDTNYPMCSNKNGDGDIERCVWLDDPSQVQRATCPGCLLKLFMLGDSAQIALTRMGMRVDVRNEEDLA